VSGRHARKKSDPFVPPVVDRAGYERELAPFRQVLRGPAVSAPNTAVELAKLERLVARYPDHARRLVDQLNPPPAAASP
jgi:hypothetical protein